MPRLILFAGLAAARQPDDGEAGWDVEVFNQNDGTVARYDLLAMDARSAR
jgi:oxepin-CoA hydrolase/3-oxo-5,6-dehydrosuberyl-CoA semialdehyde dehydrogenase